MARAGLPDPPYQYFRGPADVGFNYPVQQMAALERDAGRGQSAPPRFAENAQTIDQAQRRRQLRPLGEQDRSRTPRNHRPQQQTRHWLRNYTVLELWEVLRLVGPRKLQSHDAIEALHRLIPAAPPSGTVWQNVDRDYFKDFTFPELVNLLHYHCQRQPPEQVAQASELLVVLNVLLHAHYRDNAAVLADRDETVLSLRCRRICQDRRVLTWWELVEKKLELGKTVVVKGGSTMALSSELDAVKDLVPAARLLPASDDTLLQEIRDCELVYVCGHHTPVVDRLLRVDRLSAQLVVVNVCNSQELGRHLLAAGASCVVFWTTAANDEEASRFGPRFVTHLATNTIDNAFIRAQDVLTGIHRKPVIEHRKYKKTYDTGTVVLRSRGGTRSEYDGCRATIVRGQEKGCWSRVQLIDKGQEVKSWRTGHWEHTDSLGWAESHVVASPRASNNTTPPRAKEVERRITPAKGPKEVEVVNSNDAEPHKQEGILLDAEAQATEVDTLNRVGDGLHAA